MIESVRMSFPSITSEQNDALIAESVVARLALPGSSLGAMSGGGWASLKQRAWSIDSAPGSWGPEMKHLAQAFRTQCPLEVRNFEFFTPLAVWAWHVQLGRGEGIDWHDHHKALWSGVYYPRAAGPITFRDSGRCVSIEPAEGLLITFPPTLEHSVAEQKRGLRCSISFNLHPADHVGH